MKLNNVQKNILRFIGLHIANFVVTVLLNTCKIKIHRDESFKKLIETKQNFVVAFWHGKMMIGWYLHKNSNCAALVSKSKDGNILAHVLTRWNYKVVRGSSHVGGNEALSTITDLIKQNYSMVITPDGPTGPVYKMKAGAVIAAKRTEVPLILVGICSKRKINLKSWDKFEIPLPFSRIEVVYSEPIYIDKELDYEQTSQKILECEAMLNKLQKDALELCSN